MDVRLIDANALQRAFDDAHKDEPDFYCCNFLNNAGNPSTEWDCVDEILENAPTIEAQPVKHGKWKCVNDDEGIWMCSNCGNEISLEVGSPAEFEWFFCPYCGAYMGGE